MKIFFIKTLLAIGGGEIGRPHENGGFYPLETLEIDQEIIRLSGKKNPKLLLLPTAGSDHPGYFEVTKKYFEPMGCRVDVLYCFDKNFSFQHAEEKILSSDIVYVGGGNTLKMMTKWRKLGIDIILKKAWIQGIVLSGVSAGAICWFDCGNSDSRRFTSGSEKLIKVKGLGLIPFLCCPHYSGENNRKKDLPRMLKHSKKIAIALDDCTALEVRDDTFRILKSKDSAKAYLCFWEKGRYYEQEIVAKSEFQSLENLKII